MSVHNHPPYRPVCNERRLADGQLRGACVNDDGTPKMTTEGGLRMSEFDTCFQWETYWPHAVPNGCAIKETTDRSKVTCPSCLHALGSQQCEPPR